MRAAIRSAFRHLGLDVRRYHPASSDRARLARLLQTHAIDLVLDVGANTGQYARALRELGYRGRIVSFEPLARAHAALVRAAAADRAWTVAPRMALGAAAGELVLNVTGNLTSSSPLAPTPLTLAAAPEARVVTTESVPVERLDSVAPGYLAGATRVLLKLDVQGFEAAVLEGARGIADRLAGIQLELSLVALYEGQPLAWTVHAELERGGFRAHAFLPGFSDPATGRMLQMDGIYFRD